MGEENVVSSYWQKMNRQVVNRKSSRMLNNLTRQYHG
jgi:hypothetical protein